MGYDDSPAAFIMSLTTIAQPSYETGRNSLLLLMDLVNRRRSAPQKIVPRPLGPAGSSDAAPGRSPRTPG